MLSLPTAILGFFQRNYPLALARVARRWLNDTECRACPRNQFVICGNSGISLAHSVPSVPAQRRARLLPLTLGQLH